MTIEQPAVYFNELCLSLSEDVSIESTDFVNFDNVSLESTDFAESGRLFTTTQENTFYSQVRKLWVYLLKCNGV
jgi:hypothetical protein